MKSIIHQLFGEGQQLDTMQMAARALVMFFVALLLIRVGGIRIFGKRDALDNIIAVLMGAILSRGVVGASSFISVTIATTVMVIVHRAIAWICVHNKSIEWLVKGKKIVIYKSGQIIRKNLSRTTMSEMDLMESLRLETQLDSLEEVETATMETNGRISFVLKDKKSDPGK